MLSRKTSLLLNTIVISFLMSGSHTTLGKVSDSWEKMASQPTESQKAADAARAEREKELQAIRDSKKEPTSEEKTPLEPMKKPAEPTKPMLMPTKPHVVHTPPATSSPVEKRRTLQEQIALNKQKKAEDFRKLQEMNKEKAAAHHAEKSTVKPGNELAMSPFQRKLMASEKKSEEAPAKAMKPSVTATPSPEKEAMDEPMKKASNPPLAPKGGPKPLHMGSTQKKMMEQMESKNSTLTTHPAVDLALPPLKMHAEEHEEITLSMPEKQEAKPATQQADTKVETTKMPAPPVMPKSSTTQSNVGPTGSDRGDLLAEIQKGKQLRKTTQP